MTIHIGDLGCVYIKVSKYQNCALRHPLNEPTKIKLLLKLYELIMPISLVERWFDSYKLIMMPTWNIYTQTRNNTIYVLVNLLSIAISFLFCFFHENLKRVICILVMTTYYTCICYTHIFFTYTNFNVQQYLILTSATCIETCTMLG